MLGSNRREKKRETKRIEQEKKERIPPEIGQTGTVEDFRAANKKAYDAHNPEAQKELLKSAVQAFQQGNYANVQTMIENPNAFKLYDRGSYKNDMAAEALFQLSHGSDDPVAAIDRAYANVSEEKKRHGLTMRLAQAIQDGIGDEPFIASLLKAGASATCLGKDDGLPGYTLAWAIYKGCSLPILKTLHENKASFQDVLHLADLSESWGGEAFKKKVNVWKEIVTGTPATTEVETEVLQRILEELAELRKQVTERLPPLEPAPAADVNLSVKAAPEKVAGREPGQPRITRFSPAFNQPS